MKNEAVDNFDLQISTGEKLEEEIREKVDQGISLIDITIELKNRLWRMEETHVNRKDIEYAALKNFITIFDQYEAERVYMEHGWKKKFSGEWVKK